MSKQLTNFNYAQTDRRSLHDYFISTGFFDLLPMALELAEHFGYDEREIIEAICKVSDKFYQYPPTKNRTAWFKKVFVEKLYESRSDILAFEVRIKS